MWSCSTASTKRVKAYQSVLHRCRNVCRFRAGHRHAAKFAEQCVVIVFFRIFAKHIRSSRELSMTRTAARFTCAVVAIFALFVSFAPRTGHPTRTALPPSVVGHSASAEARLTNIASVADIAFARSVAREANVYRDARNGSAARRGEAARRCEAARRLRRRG